MDLLKSSVQSGTFSKLTLGRPSDAASSLKQLIVRSVSLKAGPRLMFVWRHKTKDITKNLEVAEALGLLNDLVGRDFLDAHLFCSDSGAQLLGEADGTARLRLLSSGESKATGIHDREKSRPIDSDASWLKRLGVTDEKGRPKQGMKDKFRQVQKFAELLSHLMAEANLPIDRPLKALDMGSGKGYLTFAIASLLAPGSTVHGIEARADLVDLCNRCAKEDGLSEKLTFHCATIAEARPEPADLFVALHACDTATDDALARGIQAKASLIIVAPCCQKELRPQLKAAPELAPALRHGIFRERHAEFATDALRALLLEWAGYRTKVFEFISTEHTAKNIMISAVRTGTAAEPSLEKSIRSFAAFYGIRKQALAAHLGFQFE